MPDEKCIGNEAANWMLNRHADFIEFMEKIICRPLTGCCLSFSSSSCCCLSSLLPPIFHPSFVPFNHPPHQLFSPLPHLQSLFVSPSSHLILHLNFSPSSPSLQELASIRRREQLVREAIAGKSPGVYSQLFKRFSISSTHFTALQCLISSGHSQLGQIGLIAALVLTAFWWFVLGWCLTLRVKWQVPKLFESNSFLIWWAHLALLSTQLS